MPSCPNCNADIITDAQFCEACGMRLSGVLSSTPDGSVEVTNVEKPEALPGSLRAEIPFLSGAFRQARARLDNWREQAERDRNEAKREEENRQQEEEETARKGGGRRSIWLMLVGLAVLVLWVWIILRWPPTMNPALKWQLLQHMLRQAGYYGPVEEDNRREPERRA